MTRHTALLVLLALPTSAACLSDAIPPPPTAAASADALPKSATATRSAHTSRPTCGGACDDLLYTPCTCGADDPCGWRGDDYCDDVCSTLTEAPFDDALDCDTDCELTLCLAGAINQSSEGNWALMDLCDSGELPGLIPDCDKSPCATAHDNFLKPMSWSTYPALFDALDTNGDARVDARDQRCAVNLIGFSWGGVNAVELAQMLIDDPNVAASRSFVDRLFLLDAYQPFAGRSMNVPGRVKKTRSFRHSVSPADDCSMGSPLGPYEGLPPRCQPGSDCLDYDFSLAPSTAFSTPDDGTMRGGDVGHCLVPWAARALILEEIGGEVTSPRPPTHPVAPHR